MNYLIKRLDGTEANARISEPLIVGAERSVKLGSDVVRLKHSSFGVLTEQSEMTKTECLLTMTLGLIGVGVILWVASLSVTMNIGLEPDADVMAAARQVGPQIEVSRSEYPLQSGCDRGDSQLYRVSVAGEQKAIICQGSVLKIWGENKAPTLRYQSR